MENQRNRKILTQRIDAVLRHPDVGVNNGLSGTTRVDHIIGRVENALYNNPDDFCLQAGYEALQQQHPKHFITRSDRPKPEIFAKPEGYKACNGF